MNPAFSRFVKRLNDLHRWIDQLRWQRLEPFQKLAAMLLDHLEGILNYCRTKVPLGVVEAINGNIKALMRRGRGYRNLRYLLLKAQRMATLKTEFVVPRKAASNGPPAEFLRRAQISDELNPSGYTTRKRSAWHHVYVGEMLKAAA